MVRKTLRSIAVLIGLAISQQAMAQTAPLPALGFKLGDDVATVKAALRTDLNPEVIPRNSALPSNLPDPNNGKTVIHLRTKGIWAFFDATGAVYTIRLDAPFAGDVLGVKIGDTAQQLKTKLGNPLKKPSTAFLVMQSYQYVIDDSAYATYDVTDEGVQIIFIAK